jgi:small nuclear ribonucleoprotein (snRNP)-like protein
MQEIEIKSDENDCYISKEEEIITTEDKEIQGELRKLNQVLNIIDSVDSETLNSKESSKSS